MSNDYRNLPIFVNVGVSEPYDFDGTDTNGFSGNITQIMEEHYFTNSGKKIDERALFVVDNPFSYQGMKCQYFIISPRYEGVSIKELLEGERVIVAMIRIPTMHGESEQPFKYTPPSKEKTCYIIATMQCSL